MLCLLFNRTIELKKYLALLLLFSIGCSKFHSDDALLTKLNQVMKPVRSMHSGYRIITLDSLTNFVWDSVYVFEGEVNAQMIEAVTGAKWDGPDVPNMHTRLFFTHRGKAVSYVDCNAMTDNFGRTEYPPLPIYVYLCDGISARHRALAKKDARFAASRNCENGRTSYALIPLKCVDKYDYNSILNQDCP